MDAKKKTTLSLPDFEDHYLQELFKYPTKPFFVLLTPGLAKRIKKYLKDIGVKVYLQENIPLKPVKPGEEEWRKI